MVNLLKIELPEETGARQCTDDAGLVLLAGSQFRPVYANVEAIHILTWPDDPTKITGLELFIEAKTSLLLRGHESSHGVSSVTEFVSGRRRYVCRTFSLKPKGAGEGEAGDDSDWPRAAILLERNVSGIDCPHVAKQFHLTAREQEALHFLFMGLTNKDIANRMHVSPNTVKTFLRTLMIKTGTSTRSGIVGKCSISRG